MTRTALAVIGLSTLLAASACGGSGEPPVSQAATPLPVPTSPAASATPAASTLSPSPAASPRPVPPAVGRDQEVVSFYGARLALPPGWQYTGEGGTGYLCADPAPVDETSGGVTCTIQVVNPVAAMRLSGETEEPDPAGDTGWYLGSDVPGCRDSANPAYATSTQVLTSRIIERDLRPMGTKRADHTVWALSCSGTRIGTARLWYLPTSKLAVISTGASAAPDARVERFVAQVDTARYDAAGPN